MLQIKTIKAVDHFAPRACSHRKLLYNLWKDCCSKKSWYRIEKRIVAVLNQFTPQHSNNLRCCGIGYSSKRANIPRINSLKGDVKILCDVQKRLFSTSSKFYNEQGDKRGKNDDNQMSTLITKALLWMLTAYMFVGLISIFFPASNQPEVVRYVSWNEFLYQMLATGEVEEIIVRPDVEIVTILLHEGAVIKGKKADARTFHMNIGDINRFEEKLRDAERSLGIMQGNGVPVVYERSSDTAGKLLFTLGFAAVLIFLLSRSKGMKFPINMDGISQFSKAKFTIIDPLLGGSKGVKFSDVAGLQEAKQEVIEFVDYLKNPERYKTLGAKVPRGALLLGPPGCGKTLLAKAVASEANVPFLTMNGSEFIEMIGGLGAARVRSLFKEARKRAPCIIYIDEIDAIGKTRNTSSSQMDGMSGEGEQTLNQLLVEMDGMTTKEEVIMLASTNRADVLDKALMRPGRFDRHIFIDYPNFIERDEIFRHHLKSIVLEKEPKTYATRLAKLTPGFSGADIANICNESALHAARLKKKRVDASDLEYAIERVVAGVEKKTQVMNLQEKRVVAFHESGHALLGWLLEHTDVLLKVTILPRTNHALGFAQYTPSDQKLFSKEQLFERMAMALGGRAAEALTFNRITTGAANDLEKVTKMAYAQVRTYGLNDKVGHLSFSEQDLQQAGRRPYSKQLGNLIDHEARALIAQAYQAAEKTLTENRDLLTKLAEALLVKETLNYDDVVELLGPPKYPNKTMVESLEFESELSGTGPPPLPGLKQKHDQNMDFRRLGPHVFA